MAKKSSKKKQEQEQKSRLYYGSQRIASIAQQEVERRQQEGFNKRAADAGIKKEYSYKDPIARTAVQEIEKRKQESLNKTLNSIKEQEQERKRKEQQEKESQAKTKSWQKLSRDATAAGHPELAYAAKMINDTAVSEEDKKKYGSDTEAKKAKLNSFISTLSQKKKAKTEQTANNYQGYKSYNQEKAANNSPLVSKEDLAKRYAGKYADKTQEEKELQDTAVDFLEKSKEGLSKKEKAGNVTKDKTQKLTIGRYNDYLRSLQDEIDAGMYDNSTDPYSKSDAGLRQGINFHRNSAKEAGDKAEKLKTDFIRTRDEWKPEESWSGIFDMLEGWDERNEEIILHGRYTPQQQATADRTLREIKNSRASRKQEMLDKAQVYFESFNQNMWKNDWENATKEEKEQLREIMYDNIMQDRYADRVKKMSPAQKEKFDAAFDEMLGEATGTNLRWEDYEDDYNTLLKVKAAHESQVGALEAEQKRRSSVYNLMKWAGESGASNAYDPNRVKVNRYSADEWHESEWYEPTGTEADKAYYYANNVPADLSTVDPNSINKYYFIAADPEILEAFTTLYNKDTERAGVRSNQADMFLKALEPYLNYCMSHYQDDWFREVAEDPVKGPIARLASYPLNAVGGMVGLAGTGLAALGVKSAQDPNSPWYITSKYATTTRQHQNEMAGDALGDLVSGWFDEKYRDQVREAVKNGTEFGLGVVDSIVDNMFSKGVGTAIAGDDYKKTGRIIQFIMSAEATSNTMIEKLQSGKDPQEAAVYAIADGAIEWFTEKVSIESWLGNDYKAMLGDKKALRKAIRNSMIAEGGEEINADVLNMGVDLVMSAINGHETELHEKYNKLIANGMEPTEAGQKVLMDKVGELIRSGAAGAMSGGLMVGGLYAGTAINQRQIGKQMNIKNAEGQTKTSELVDLAMETDQDSLAHKQAAEIRQQIENGEEVSDRDAGRLVQTLQAEAQEMLEKAENGEDVSPEAVRKSVETLRSVAEITGQIKKSTRDIGSRMATQEEISEAEGERIQGQREAVYTDPQTGKATITKIDGVKLTQDDNKQWHLGVQVTVNGIQRTVAPNELRMTNYRASEIVNKAAAFPEFYSEGYTNLLLDAAENNQISEEHLDQAMNDAAMVRLFAYAGFLNSELPKTSLSKGLTDSIWKQSAEEHGANRTSQVAEANRQETGRVMFDGAEYGTEEYNRKVAGMKLSRQTREWMDAVAGIAQRAGIRADFTITDDDMTYGWESPEGIGLNISGMNYELDQNGKPQQTGQKHHLLVTFGHEMTHWLQRNSMQGYNRLEQYVLKSYINDRGAEDLMRQLNNKMNRGEMLNLEDAISEFVANSCDQILGSEQVRDRIAQTDGKLFSQIKGFVKDLVNRFKNAIKGMDASASYEAQQMAGRMNELSKVWLGAYDEALTKTADITTENSGKERYALSPYSDAEMMNWRRSNTITVYNGNEEMLDRFIYRNLDDPTHFEKMYFGKIDSRLAERIRNETGVETEGLNLTLRSSELYKIMVNDHGDYTSETNRGQIPVTANEILEAVKTIEEPDTITKGSYDGQGAHHDAITFTKNINGRVVAYTFVARKKHDLILQTIYKNIKKEDVAPAGDANTSPQTSKTNRGTVSDKKISQNDQNGKTRSSRYHAPNEKGYWTGMNTVQRIGGEYYVVNQETKERTKLEGTDREYAEAWFNGDRARMEEILMEKIREAGAVPIKYAQWYDNALHRWVADAIKDGDPKAIGYAASEMAEKVPKNAVLVPMPDRTGKVTENTDTMLLAKAISERTGNPVINALEGNNRESRKEDKNKPKNKQMTAKDLGFRQVEEIPDGMIPYFIDNLIAAGVTAKAAHDAFGTGITLAYAKGQRSGDQGIKDAEPTFYDRVHNGQFLIPLHERVDMSKKGSKGVRFSKAQLDERYDQAVKSGDEIAQRALVATAAEEAGYNVKAYHGTSRADRVGTVFRPERATSGPMAFFTDNREIAEGYARDKRDTSIDYDDEYGDYYNQFRVTIRGKNVPVGKLWSTLSFAERQKITEAAKHITLDDEAENIIWNDAVQYGLGNFNDYERKLHGWNSIDTLIDSWLQSGTLWKREGDFLKVLEMAGIKDVTWNNPDARDEKVYDVFLKIQNPFVVNEQYTGKFLEDLESWWMMQDKEQYEHETASADMWDKNNITVDEWIRDGFGDVADGYTSNWTRIPDGVSAYLESLGYDGIQDEGGKGGRMGHTVWIPFSSEQVKSADPVTYDDEGNIIPPSERFNDEKTDIRWSRWTEDAMDVSAWMANATASTVQTEDERILLDAFRGMRIKMSLSLKKQMDYKAKIRQLEGKANLTAEQKSELTTLRNRLEIEENKYARMEDEMFKVTNADGWAGMMYRENMLLKDYIQGKTQDQVRQTVEDMLKLVKQTQDQIEKDTAELKKLAEAQAVKTMKSFMGKTSLGRAAATLRKAYNSTMAKAEIEDRLAEIALKQASGKDITSDTELLAQDLIDKVRGIRSDALENLRGTTLVIGQSLADELKAENSSIKELQSRLKGSGVKLVTGQKSSTGEIDKHSRISEQWSELREKDQSLPDVENMAEIDKLHTIVDFIEGELRASSGAEQFNVDFDEVQAMVRAQAGLVTTYLVDDPKARAQITNLMKQIAELSKKTESTAENMEKLYDQLDEVVLAGQKAKGWTTILQRDVNEAIRYYNKTAKVAAETERNRVRKELIEKLRSDHAKDLIKQQEKFREQIANDKKARELAQDNLALRSKISTVATRMANRIFAETDQKNVPEEAKALVRQVIDMLSQHDGFFRKVTYWDRQQVDDIRLRIQKMIANYGQFNPDTDLNWLVVGEGQDADTTAQEKVIQDLINIESGLMEYRNAEGKGRISLADRKAALTKVQEALSEIWNVVKARSEMEIAGRKWQVIELAELMRDEMQKSRFKGERIGFGNKARNAMAGGITWGNLTPEYFFKGLKNRAMELLHTGLKDAENRSGLEAAKAKDRLEEIAQRNGFASWDGQEEHKVKTRSGEITMTTEQIMALYATWLRESNQMRPEDTAHLLNGGFVLAAKEKNKGLPGREKSETRPIRIGKEHLAALAGYLTDEQIQYVNDMVAYMSSELAELGNEASMRMYGIKKFTEQFYFPIKSWGGVLNKRSDAGISSNNENRAAQQGFSKRIKNNASNAIEIGDFTPTAIKHVAGMITYNTVGPAIENMNKVLNQQLQYGGIKYTEDGEVEEDDTYKRNMRAAFQEAYGKQAADYLATFMQDMNGGVGSRYGNTLWDKLLSLFKKSAVAGSLSVAAQQPLSYIRAAMMINPKYLAKALTREMWTGAYKELKNYSGLAVIKEMGKFDMNFGQSMQDWITPEGMVKSKGKAAWEWFQNKSTALPGWMDALTWTRMWVAVKAEQHAMHPEMDVKSDAFLNTAAERFNDLMRQTQVYDSVMVKSQNMRSQNQFAKTITSFMAEPTLSLNVLADAFQNVKEKGGGRKAAKALVLFAISAAAQAAVKAAFSTGRSPDKKKNEWENFLYRLGYNLINEANPIGLIPGYSNLVDALKDGEMTDNALSIVGKAKDIVESLQKMISAGEGYNWYRGIEDTLGQALQLGTNVPAKNMMRDFRALVNLFSGGSAEWLTGGTYAKRPTSSAMLKHQLIETISKEDLIGLVNTMLGDAGYKTDANAYYERIYEAEKAGDQQKAEEMKEYLTLKSTAEDPAKSINDALRGLAKADDTLSEEERTAYVINTSTDKGGSNYVISQVKEGKLSGTAARKMLKEIYPDKDDDTIWWQVDRAEYTAETGKQLSSNDMYYRLKDAINGNKSDDIKETVNTLLKHGITKDKIKGKLSDWKSEYLAATGKDKTRLEDALTKAYKAIGLTAAEALKIIHGWKQKKTK